MIQRFKQKALDLRDQLIDFLRRAVPVHVHPDITDDLLHFVDVDHFDRQIIFNFLPDIWKRGLNFVLPDFQIFPVP